MPWLLFNSNAGKWYGGFLPSPLMLLLWLALLIVINAAVLARTRNRRLLYTRLAIPQQ
jgi:hypothetical protein